MAEQHEVKKLSSKYKKLMVIPVLILILSIGILVNKYAQTGEWFERSIELKGGTLVELNVNIPVDVASLEQNLKQSFGPVIISQSTGIAGRQV